MRRKSALVVIIIVIINLFAEKSSLSVIAATTVLSGTRVSFTGNVNLSEEGKTDWRHWGSSPENKAGGNLISDITTIGNVSNSSFLNDSMISYTWTDGTSVQNQSGTSSGKHTGDAGNGGFSFTVPVSDDIQILNVYGSAWGVTGNFSAALDDGSTPYTTKVDSEGVKNTYYKIQIIFSSDSAQTLTVRFTTDKFYDTEWGNISIHAAALHRSDKPVILLDGEEEVTLNEGELFNDPFVKAYDKTSDITDLVTVEGAVDTNRYGEYIITYNVENKGSAAEPINRKVYVVPMALTAEAVRETDGSKSIVISGAAANSIIKLYDNSSAYVGETTANLEGKAKFENLVSISYKVTQVVDSIEGTFEPVYFEPDLEQLPKIILEDHPQWAALYESAWEMHKKNTKKSVSGSGFTDYYVDENFNEYLFQWDILFMSLFNVYGYSEFPGIDTLDNFYRYQEENGFICRVISEKDGSYGYGYDSSSYNAVNPPLFAYAEWKYYEISGDKSRFDKEINGLTIIERLENLFYYIKRTRTYSDGTYHTNGQANGMDNTPGYDVSNLSWNDLACQQAQSAYYIAKMAEVLGDTETRKEFEIEYEEIKIIINQKHWDSEDEFYYLINRNTGELFKSENQRTPMGWWPMAANISDNNQAKSLVERYIMNPDEFWRPMGITSLSRQSGYYDNSGDYWRGGVWAPLEYMTNIALKNYGYNIEAFQNAVHYLNALNTVYTEENKPFTVYTNSGRKVYDVNKKYSGTLWEMYQPEYVQPGGTEDYGEKGDIGLVRKDFVGWTGLGPIAMMIEDILGLRINAPENKLEWHLNLVEKNGIQNLRFGDNVVSITADKRNTADQKANITVTAKKAFYLKVYIGGICYETDVEAGSSSFEMGNGTAGEPPLLDVKKTRLPDAVIDLTAEGNLDWMQCGTDNINRKNRSNRYISDWRIIGKNDTVKATENDSFKFSWSDSISKTGAAETSTGVVNYDSGQGFEFTVPADTKSKTLKIYVSSYAIDSKLNVEISDGSSINYMDYHDPEGSVSSYYVYTINYRASDDEQFLTVRYTGAGNIYDDENGGVSIYAVSLSGDESLSDSIIEWFKSNLFVIISIFVVIIICSVMAGMVLHHRRKH